MKHLCIDARILGPCGIGTFLSNMIKMLLKQKRYKITLLCHKKYQNTFPEAHTLTVVSPVYSVKEQGEFFKKIPPCDLFWSPHFNIPLLPIKAKKRLVTIHDVYHLAYKNEFSFIKRHAANLLYNAAFSLSDTVVTVSTFSKEEIVKHARWGLKELRIVSPGVNLTHFVPCQDHLLLDEVRKRYSLPEKFFLAVGNDRPHKNLYTLLKGYEKAQIRNVSLVVVGRCLSEKNALFSLIKKTPYLKRNVQFTGVVLEQDLPVIYSLATALCYPSLYEGYGSPPLEAFACKCPVIASKRASLAEVLSNGALTLDDPFCLNQLADALHKVAKDCDLRQELIEKGYNQVQRHCLTKSAEKYLSIIDEIVAS